MQSGTIRLDIHGMTCTQAQAAIDAAHGDFRNVEARTKELAGIVRRRGTIAEDRAAIQAELDRHPRVKRLEVGLNQGATELVLREYV